MMQPSIASPAPMTPARHRPFFIVIAVIAIVLAVGYFGYNQWQKKSEEKKFISDWRQSYNLEGQGKYEEALNLYETLINRKTDDITAATKIKLRTAYLLFATGGVEERKQAVGIYKAIVADQEVSSMQKAFAISELADLLMGTQDITFATEYVLTGEPYSSFVTGDFGIAMRKFYEWSFDTYPTAIAAFNVAKWYGEQLSINKKIPDELRQKYAEELTKWVKEGNYRAETDMARFGYSQAKRAQVYALQGLGARLINSATGEKSDMDMEEVFQKAMSIITYDLQNRPLVAIGLRVRFSFAAALAELYGEKRAEDINELIQPIIDAPDKNKYLFFEALRNETDPGHAEHLHHADLLRLAALNPQFKDLLNSFGWDIK